MGTLGGAGADGLSPNITQAFPTTADGSIPDRANLDQPTAETLLKQQMKTSPGWQSAHQAGFAGLPDGIPLVLGIIAKFAEQFTGLPISTWIEQWTANPVVSNLFNVVTDALGKVFTVSSSLQSLFDSLDFTDPDFNPIQALIKWIQNDLIPTGLFNLFGIDEFIKALELLIFSDENIGGMELPAEGLILDFELATLSPVQKWFRVVRAFLGILNIDFDDLDISDLPGTITTIATGFITTILNPLGILANITDLQELADAIGDALEGIPVVGGIAGAFWDSITAMLGLTQSAQATGDNATVEVMALKAQVQSLVNGGIYDVERFDAGDATTLADYNQYSVGGSLGTYGRLNGKGHFYTTFGDDQIVVSVHSTRTLNTPGQRCAIKMEGQITLGGGVYLGLIARPNFSGDDCCYALVGPTTIDYGYLLGGVLHPIATVSGAGSSDVGQTWELELGGVGNDDWLWVVKRDGATKLSTINSAPGSLFLDTDHRAEGFAAGAANFFGAQAGPPDFLTVTWVDI